MAKSNLIQNANGYLLKNYLGPSTELKGYITVSFSKPNSIISIAQNKKPSQPQSSLYSPLALLKRHTRAWTKFQECWVSLSGQKRGIKEGLPLLLV